MPAHPRRAEQRPVRAGEAEDAVDGRHVLVGERLGDSGDLLVQAVDELGAIAPGDEELRLPEQGRLDDDLAVDVLASMT